VTARVAVAPDVLIWAQRRSGRSGEELAQHFKRWSAWVSGEQAPTVKQVQALASYTHLPFGYFFLPEPPVVGLPVPDFRVGREWQGEPSQDLIDVLHASLRRQAWYRDFALRRGDAALDFVGSVSDRQVNEVAAELRSRLAFEVHQRTVIASWADARRYLLHAFEGLGGLTVATSMVDNNTHRLLDPREFQGFTLADEFAPLIFVNAANTLAAQIFTILHEIAHVWRGESGVSNEQVDLASGNATERWCNAIASEILVPISDLQDRYSRDRDLTPELDRLARVYRCSTLVVLIRLRESERINQHVFDTAYPVEVERLRLASASRGRSGGGGDFYLNQPYRIGERVSRAVIIDTLEGTTALRDAMRLLSFSKVSQFDTYAKRLGIG
jgi:Zn-dependent peptidase ImmA (M78 family)